MGKRSNFKRKPRDFYPTPYEAVAPLLPHLDRGLCIYEPCAGDGTLMHWLEDSGFDVVGGGDIEPQIPFVFPENALEIEGTYSDIFITNPPWKREILHPLITHLSNMAPTWLLFDADWAHTKQSAEFMPRCQKIVSIGRIKWIPDSKMTGKDNCAWYLFDKNNTEQTKFYGRAS